MIKIDNGGLQAPNSLPLWHQAPKRELIIIVTIAISIGLGRIIITSHFFFFIISTGNLLTAVVKLNIIITKRVFLGHKVIPRVVDSRSSRIVPRLTN